MESITVQWDDNYPVQTLHSVEIIPERPIPKCGDWVVQMKDIKDDGTYEKIGYLQKHEFP